MIARLWRALLRRPQPRADTPSASPWWPTTDPRDLKHLGKLIEESGELTAIMGRIITQGIDGLDPKTGKPNRVAFAEEIADSICKSVANMEHFGLDSEMIYARMAEKTLFHREWFTWDRPEQG